MEIIYFFLESSEVLFIPIATAVIAVAIGEFLRNRNYKKQQKDDLLRRIIHYRYQLTSDYKENKNEILGALNEIQYWYHNDNEIKKLVSDTLGSIKTRNKNSDELLVNLIFEIANHKKLELSKTDINETFSPRKTDE
ncbi:MAG: DUF6680 family protein [Candidatus Paceibacterota bacterium]|jgi:hypothetical protein